MDHKAPREIGALCMVPNVFRGMAHFASSSPYIGYRRT